jgi:hypothetical protein
MEVVLQVVSLHHQGFSYRAISDILNAEGLSTPAGRPRWQRSYVDRLLHTHYVEEILRAHGEPACDPSEEPFPSQPPGSGRSEEACA